MKLPYFLVFHPPPVSLWKIAARSKLTILNRDQKQRVILCRACTRNRLSSETEPSWAVATICVCWNRRHVPPRPLHSYKSCAACARVPPLEERIRAYAGAESHLLSVTSRVVMGIGFVVTCRLLSRASVIALLRSSRALSSLCVDLSCTVLWSGTTLIY